DVGERERKHQYPEHRARPCEPVPPEQHGGYPHHQDEERPEPNHDVIAVVQELNVGRPIARREVVQPVDGAAEGAIGQEAEHARPQRAAAAAPETEGVTREAATSSANCQSAQWLKTYAQKRSRCSTPRSLSR